MDFPERSLNELILAKHETAHKNISDYRANNDKQTKQKSSCNDTKASVLRSWALSFQWHIALSYSRRKDEINTKSLY